MERWRTRTALLALLFAASLLGQGGHAAGLTAPAAPGAPAAPTTCSSLAGAAATPAALLPLDSAAAAALGTCRCGDSVCVGKPVESRCGPIRFCNPTGTCAATATQKCSCGPPP
jgi:hypothetical protein